MHKIEIPRPKWFLKTYLWATEQLYGPCAWAYDSVAWLVSFGCWSRWRFDILAYVKSGRILEIGFGTGELLMALVARGHEIIGLELSPNMHKVTDEKLQRKNVDVVRLRGRAEAIPLKSDTFDTVISTFPSNYIFNEASLREIKRVLNREGRCLVLGLGVRFESGLKRWLTSLWMSKHLENLIQVFMQRTEKMGLRAVCIQHQADGYSLPVVILERSHAN